MREDSRTGEDSIVRVQAHKVLTVGVFRGVKWGQGQAPEISEMITVIKS